MKHTQGSITLENKKELLNAGEVGEGMFFGGEFVDKRADQLVDLPQRMADIISDRNDSVGRHNWQRWVEWQNIQFSCTVVAGT